MIGKRVGMPFIPMRLSIYTPLSYHKTPEVKKSLPKN